jgi:hypothetical protein
MQTAHDPTNIFFPFRVSIAKMCVEPTSKVLLSNKKAYNKRNKEGSEEVEASVVCKLQNGELM